MRFSILIPVFNSAEYIRECLESILCQRCLSEYEVIIVDDGSTDASNHICEQYAIEHSEKITLFRQSNKGSLAARCQSIALAHGEYCVFLDSDDALRDNALCVLDELVTRTDADIISFQASRSRDFEKPILDYSMLLERVPEKETSSIDTAREILSKTHEMNSLWSKVIRTSCLKSACSLGKLDRIRYGEDLLIVATAFNNANSFSWTSEILYYYRLNCSGTTHTVEYSRFTDIVAARNIFLEMVETWDYSLARFANAVNCIEVLAFTVRYLNTPQSVSRSERKQVLNRVVSSDFFIESCRRADMKGCSLWKRFGIFLLKKRTLNCFILYIELLFKLLSLLSPRSIENYCS